MLINRSYKIKIHRLKKLGKAGLAFVASAAIGLYPVLFFYASNLQEVTHSMLVLPGLAVLVANAALLTFGYLLLRNATKAGLLAGLFWVLFFSYGRVFTLIEKQEAVAKHPYVLVIWLGLLLAGALILKKLPAPSRKVLEGYCFAGIIMVGFQIVTIARFNPGSNESPKSDLLVNQDVQRVALNPTEKPDIYYVVLDSYPRLDTLKEYFNYDNGGFEDSLEKRGFYIPSRSLTNYNHTIFSVPSTLNMSFIKDPKPELVKTKDLFELYHRNNTLHLLKRAGYRYVNNSNLYSTQQNPVADHNTRCGHTNEFLLELANTTALLPLGYLSQQARQDKRSDALCVMDNMPRSDLVQSPQFVLTHLLPPHPPYLFGANGEDVEELNLSLTSATRWLAKQPYLEQLKYVNKRVSAAVDQILQRSPNAIIILQSDHGPLSSATEANTLSDTRPVVITERARNLMAVRLPPSLCQQGALYETITPVNLFRTIFNSCFGTNLPLLEDRSFVVPHRERNFKDFRDVTQLVRSRDRNE